MLRTIHLYLGLTLAPLLLFFVLSGAWQVFDLHKSRKDGSYHAPRILSALSEVHVKQRQKSYFGTSRRAEGFRWLASTAGAGFAILAVLGVVMTFRTSRNKWLPAGMLCLGTLLPVSLFYLGGG